MDIDEFQEQLNASTTMIGTEPTLQIGALSLEICKVTETESGPVIHAHVSDELERLTDLWINFLQAESAISITRAANPGLHAFARYITQNHPLITKSDADAFTASQKIR